MRLGTVSSENTRGHQKLSYVAAPVCERAAKPLYRHAKPRVKLSPQSVKQKSVSSALSRYTFFGKIASTGAQAHALFDADAAQSYPAFSLKGLCTSRSYGQCRESERYAAVSEIFVRGGCQPKGGWHVYRHDSTYSRVIALIN